MTRMVLYNKLLCFCLNTKHFAFLFDTMFEFSKFVHRNKWWRGEWVMDQMENSPIDLGRLYHANTHNDSAGFRSFRLSNENISF